MKPRRWEDHYTSARSELHYPDENLVRLLAKSLSRTAAPAGTTAVDLGCGSGRHIKLLSELGFPHVIGTDASYNALALSRKWGPALLLQADNRRIPLKSASADIIIAWGSLHYSVKDDLPGMLEEICRVLKKGGALCATLRSSRDSHLKRGKDLGNDTWITDLNDIQGSIASFYTEDELVAAFARFGQINYGLIERTLVGDLSSLISHWVIEARK